MQASDDDGEEGEGAVEDGVEGEEGTAGVVDDEEDGEDDERGVAGVYIIRATTRPSGQHPY